MKSVARVLVAGLLLAAGCSPSNRVDSAFHELDRALPSEWRRLSTEDSDNVRSARYDAKGEPAELVALVRSSLVAQGFTLFPGNGLPDRSVTPPPPMSNQTPATVPLITLNEPLPVDAIQVGDFRGKTQGATSRSVSFYPGSRPGWTLVDVKANAEG